MASSQVEKLNQLSDEETKTDDSDAEEDMVGEQPDTNTLVFKCMGCHKETRYQKALERVRDLMAEGKSVPVAIVPEKTNIYDARAWHLCASWITNPTP